MKAASTFGCVVGLCLSAALFAAFGVADRANARELWRRGEAYVDLSGSLLEQVVLTQGTGRDRFGDELASDSDCILASTFHECDAFKAVGEWLVPVSLTRMRTKLEVRVDEHWSAAIEYDHEVRVGRLEGFGAVFGDEVGRSTFLGAEQTIVDDKYSNWRHLLYRGFVQFESEHFEATVGRQRIPWGVGRLWNPIDRFNAIPPLALQASQSAGVDAVDVRWLLSGFTFVEGVFAPGTNSDERSVALRLHGVAADIDYSLMAGVFEKAWTGGFDLAANLGDAAARLEFVYTDPERDVWPVGRSRPRELAPFVQLVASIDYLFDMGTGVYVLVEYLYNGNGLGFGKGRAGPLLPFFEATDSPPDPALAGLPGPFVTTASDDIFGGSRVITRSEHLTGLSLGYDVTPEIRFDWLVLIDWQGISANLFPSLRFTPRDWLEIAIGVQVPVGPHRSEYGSLEPLGFIQFEAFF